MGQTFICKKSDCGEEVPYENEAIIGLSKWAKLKPKFERKTKVVYLTCPNDHTYPYNVTEEEGG